MSTRKPTSEERESLGFFWELYESVREEIDEALREKALEYPEFARIARQRRPGPGNSRNGQSSRMSGSLSSRISRCRALHTRGLK
jgi:hypothetical protein